MNLRGKATSIKWRKCPECPAFWPYASCRTDGTYSATRCPKCRKKKKQNNPAKVLTEAELARRTAKIREAWSEEDYRRRCVLPETELEVRVVRICLDND